MTTATKGTNTQIKKVVKPTKKVNKKETLEDTNKKVVTQKVIVHRELKYLYPKDLKDTLGRKTYRQKVRNTIYKMERDIQKLKDEDRKVLKEKLEDYKLAHLVGSTGN